MAIQHVMWACGYRERMHFGATTKNAARVSLQMSGLKCGSVGKARLKMGYCAKSWNVTSARMNVDVDVVYYMQMMI
eukprot:562038-Karenia_brevis.AAC.1